MSAASFVLVLSLCLVTGSISQDDTDYSWRMLGGNLQRNSRAEWQMTALKNPNVTWAFFAQDQGDEFVHSPVYSYPDDTVYTISYGGFIYAVSATTGKEIWETCVGKPPVFPNDPCSNIKNLNMLPYGQLTLLSGGDVIVQVQNDVQNGADKMLRISKKDGSIEWTLNLFVDPVDSNGNDHFYSLPTVVPCNHTFVNGSECILVWITKNSTFTVYTIINAETGKVEMERYWPSRGRSKFVTAPMVVDPVDGNVVSQYVDIEVDTCGRNFDEESACIGVGKFHTWTGEKIWNQTMEESWSNGMMAIDKGIIHAGSDQLYAYSYNAADGSIRWKIMETAASFDMFYAGVCADGTVVYADDGHYTQGWTPDLVRKKQPLFWEGCNGNCAKIPAMTNEGTYYMLEGNSVYAHSCKDGSVLWNIYFGAGDSFVCPIAIGKDAIYANVYKSGDSGALVKLEDP